MNIIFFLKYTYLYAHNKKVRCNRAGKQYFKLKCILNFCTSQALGFIYNNHRTLKVRK